MGHVTAYVSYLVSTHCIVYIYSQNNPLAYVFKFRLFRRYGVLIKSWTILTLARAV